LAVLSVLEDGPLHGYELARRIEQQTKGAFAFSRSPRSIHAFIAWSSAAGFVAAGKPASRDGAAAAIRLTARERQSFPRCAKNGRKLFSALRRLTKVSHA